MSLLIPLLLAASLSCWPAPVGLLPSDGNDGYTNTTTSTSADGNTVGVTVEQSGTTTSGGSGGSGGSTGVTPLSRKYACTDSRWQSLCAPNPRPNTPPRKPTTAEIARQAAAQLTLPAVIPTVQPNPADNEWDMLAVGFPLWLYAPVPAPLSQTLTQSGLTLTLRATPVWFTFGLGNGATVSCARPQARPGNLADPMTPAPACGYVYLDPGVYTISLALTWRVDWTAAGLSGSFEHTPPGTVSPEPLPIGELHAVITTAGDD